MIPEGGHTIRALLPLALKRRVARLLKTPLMGKAVKTLWGDTLSVGGFRIAVDEGIVDLSTRAALFFGLYESAERRFVEQYLRGDLPVVELGGGLGVVSCYVQEVLDSGTPHIIVEANPDMKELLTANLRTNFPEGNYKILNKGIDQSGKEKDWASFSSGQKFTTGKLTKLSDQADRGQFIEILSLTDVVRDASLDRFSLISDIEGAEVSFIEHEVVLSRCQQMIIELHDSMGENSATIKELQFKIVDRGFQLLDQHGATFVFEREDSGSRW